MKLSRLTQIILAACIMLPAGATVWRMKYADPSHSRPDTLMHLPSATRLVFHPDSGTMTFEYSGGGISLDFNTFNRGELELKEEFANKIILQGNLRIPVGQLDTLKAYHIGPELDTISTRILWSSDNPSVATVDSMGIVRVRRRGSVTITAVGEHYSWPQTSCIIESDVLTGINAPTASTTQIWIEGKSLYIKNSNPSVPVRIYAPGGILMARGNTDSSGDALIPLTQTHTPAIIRIGTSIHKLF